MLPSTANDRKNSVSKKRKKELYEIGIEKISNAIEMYLANTQPRYRHKRDNFFNNILDNYLNNDYQENITQHNQIPERYNPNKTYDDWSF